MPDPDSFEEIVERLRIQAATATSEDEMRAIVARIAAITRNYRIKHGIGLPADPAEQALELDPDYLIRPHTAYLSARIANAVRDVERGRNRQLIINLPPRMGKSTLVSDRCVLWLLRRHPEWKIILTSYDGGLTQGWAANVRRTIEDRPSLGIALQRDWGAVATWETLEHGGLTARSIKAGITGRGGRVFVIDDPVKDFVEAHSPVSRQALWDWWLSVAQLRLEPPYLVLVVMTRWHEDDFVGRLLSPEWEGDPRTWEKIAIPALAEEQDLLGRGPGSPLLSPLIDESEDAALARWEQVRANVGSYTFSAMYQQRPAPQKGAIFDAGWWRFWSWDPAKATEDGKVVHLDPASLTGGRWLDSWDLNFMPGGDYAVGQRWVRHQANRYLIAQQRGRFNFTQTITALERWAITNDQRLSPCGHLVHERLIENAANGAAAIATLRDRIAGLKPINATTGKEVRARAITPEVESGNVFLPHPSDPGNEWVGDLLSELRNFPHDAHDDQVDALTQALVNLRDPGRGSVSVPGRSVPSVVRDVAAAARSDLARHRGPG